MGGCTSSDVMTDERELLRACIEGEKRAWAEFVDQYSRLVYSTITNTLRVHHVHADQTIVEDLFQDFFVSLLRDHFKKLRQFRGERGCSLASWLRMVGTRLTIDFLRKQKQLDVLTTEATAESSSDPYTGLIDKEQERLLAEALSALPAGDRLLIELSFKELAAEDIAAILGTSVNAVYTRKSRIVVKLRETIRQGGVP